MIDKFSIEEAAVKLVVGTRDHFAEIRKQDGREEGWKKALRAYHNDTNSYYQGKSRISVPALHNAAETVAPILDKAVFPPDGNFFEAVAKNAKDDISVEDAELVTSLIKQQFVDVEAQNRFIGAYRNLMIYGTVFITTFWDKRTKRRFKRVGGERKEVWETVFDNPDFYFPSVWDVYIDPKDENLEGALVERVIKNYHELWGNRKQNGSGVYEVEKLEEIKRSRHVEETDPDKRDRDSIQGNESHKYSEHEHKVEILKYWGDVPLYFFTESEEDEENEEVVENAYLEVAVVGDKGVALRITDNPFDHQEKPYIKIPYMKLEGEAYGVSPFVVNMPLQEELNTVRNQIIDNRTFNLRKKFVIDDAASINLDELKDIDGQCIKSNAGVNAIRELDFRDMTQSAAIHEQTIKKDIEDGTGASKLLGGSPTGTSLDRTAAGVATVAQGSLERIELVSRELESGLKKLVTHFWQLNQQFLPKGREVAMTGANIIRVVPAEIPLDGMHLNFNGLKEIGQKNFIINALTAATQTLPNYANLGLDPVPAVLELFRLMGLGRLLKDIDKRPETQLEESPEGEVQLLQLGRNVRISLNDDHNSFLRAYETMLEVPITADIEDEEEYAREFFIATKAAKLPENVKRNLLEAVGQRIQAKKILESGRKDTPNV